MHGHDRGAHGTEHSEGETGGNAEGDAQAGGAARREDLLSILLHASLTNQSE